MKINNVEVEFNVYDANTASRYEGATNKWDETIKNATAGGLTKSIRVTATATKDFFDTMFGSGAGVAICGKEDNLTVCMEAYKTILEEEDRQAKAQEQLNDVILAMRGVSKENIEKAKESMKAESAMDEMPKFPALIADEKTTVDKLVDASLGEEIETTQPSFKILD